MNYVAWLWQSVRGVRLNMAFRVAVGALQVSLGLAMVWLSKRFIDDTIRNGSDDDVIFMVGLLVLTVVGNVVLRQVYYYLTSVATIRQSNALRLSMFGRLFTRKLYSEKELLSGDVTSRFSKDVELVSEVATAKIPQMMVTAIQLLGAFLMLRWFDPRLAWALVILTPLALVFGKFVSYRLRKMTLKIREGESRIQMHVQEGVENNAVLRSLGSAPWVSERLDSMQSELHRDVVRQTRFSVISRLAFGGAFGLGYLMAFVWGGIGLRNGTITFGVMTSFLQLVGQIQGPILSILNNAPRLIHATASIDRLQELQGGSGAQGGKAARSGTRVAQDAPSALGAEMKAAEGAARLGVRLENVRFRYAGADRDAVRNYTHDFRPGSKTAIMGETGVGKTTLFRLMLGLVEPEEGRALVYSEDSLVGDSRDPAQNFERQVSADTCDYFVYVPQGNTLMSGTVRYNLQLAKPSATEEELRQVLQTACAEFVSDLPDGLDTELGERGMGLSEGQAERIAIARGLLRPGSILLLDEISSALDEPTERELFQRLFQAYPTKTMIFITHRSAVAEMPGVEKEKIFYN
ncbi:MAG: ABC transporter ATP-binding protein [Fibrobacter sp.]|nr:ABC transporter ATP-binding protein [Fibrobacter sp.]